MVTKVLEYRSIQAILQFHVSFSAFRVALRRVLHDDCSASFHCTLGDAEILAIFVDLAQSRYMNTNTVTCNFAVSCTPPRVSFRTAPCFAWLFCNRFMVLLLMLTSWPLCPILCNHSKRVIYTQISEIHPFKQFLTFLLYLLCFSSHDACFCMYNLLFILGLSGLFQFYPFAWNSF